MNSKSNSNSKNIASQRSFAYYKHCSFLINSLASRLSTPQARPCRPPSHVSASSGGNGDLLMVTSCPNTFEKETNLLYLEFPSDPSNICTSIYNFEVPLFPLLFSKINIGIPLGFVKIPVLSQWEKSNEPPWHPGRHWVAAKQQAFIWRSVVGEFVLGTAWSMMVDGSIFAEGGMLDSKLSD